jgi:tripartite-type tricarboxylate transporter receptor subunit TctC
LPRFHRAKRQPVRSKALSKNNSGGNMKLTSALAGATIALTAGTFATPAPAQDFPTRDISLIVGFPAGGSTDLLARIIADAMSKELGQRIVVENRGGANAATATRAVARSPADGYMLLFNSGNMAANLVGMKEPGYQWSDFAPIGGFAYAPFIMIANTQSSNAKTLQEFVAFGKANPGKLTYGTLGPSSAPNLVANRFGELSGIGYREVPYKGAAQITQDLLSGNLHVYFGLPSTGISIQDQPNIAVFGISDSKRSPYLPNTPTFAELGYAAVNDTGLSGIWAPAGTPKPVLDRLRKAMADAMKAPEVKAQLDKAGQLLYEGSVEQFDAEFRKVEAIYRADFKKLGIEPQ